jgi:hypothetical protein
MNLKNLLSSSTIRLALVAGASCLILQSANATLLFSEAFNYTPGTALSGNGPWTTGSSPGLTIGSGNLTYSGLADQGGNDLVIVNGTATSGIATYANQTAGQVYYSFLFDPQVVNGGNNYVTALNPGTGAPNGGSDAIDVYSYANGKVELRANAAAATAGTGTALTLGTTYLIVEEIDLDAKTANLWINPTPGAAAPTATASISGITATAVDDVGFKAAASTGSFLVDNLLIGTTWADVTPAAVPEPSSILLAGAGIGMMVMMIRRRRS